MGIFGDLMQKVFHHAAVAERPFDAAPPSAPPPAVNPVSAVSESSATVPIAAIPTNVDVAAILDGLAAKSHEKLDWHHSIVDMMKLLGMDSSLHARKELAADLNYSGDTNDSASMNIWLHKEVMIRLAANGGKVPADLLPDSASHDARP